MAKPRINKSDVKSNGEKQTSPKLFELAKVAEMVLGVAVAICLVRSGYVAVGKCIENLAYVFLYGHFLLDSFVVAEILLKFKPISKYVLLTPSFFAIVSYIHMTFYFVYMYFKHGAESSLVELPSQVNTTQSALEGGKTDAASVKKHKLLLAAIIFMLISIMLRLVENILIMIAKQRDRLKYESLSIHRVCISMPPEIVHGPLRIVFGRPERIPPTTVHGPPAIDHGPPVIDHGPPAIVNGPPEIVHGPSAIVDGPLAIVHGPPEIVHGPPAIIHVPLAIDNGPPAIVDGPLAIDHGPPAIVDGPLAIVHGPPEIVHGPPAIVDGPLAIVHGPPEIVHGPPAIVDGPLAIVYGPPEIVHGPLAIVHGPPAIVHGPPEVVKGPPAIRYVINMPYI